MDAKDLTKGTRIYYGGDMANEEGLGVIVEQATDAWGTWVDIKMDDGREINKLSIVAFSDEYKGHGGTRFVTEEAYRDFRQAEINKVEATLARKDAKRSVSDDELDAMLEDASKEAEKRGEPDTPLATSQILYRDDFRGDKMYVWEGLCHAACLKPSMTDEITVYVNAPREITKEEYDGKAPAVELRCQGCHCWEEESTWERRHDKDGDFLECLNCGTWNDGEIDVRPVDRVKKVAVQSFFKEAK
jgi:hypothetical protein